MEEDKGNFKESLTYFSEKYKEIRDSGNQERIFEEIIKPSVISLILQKESSGKKQLYLSSQRDSYILNQNTKTKLLNFLKDEGFRVTVQGDNNYSVLVFQIYWK